jgi:hypothetical protein
MSTATRHAADDARIRSLIEKRGRALAAKDAQGVLSFHSPDFVQRTDPGAGGITIFSRDPKSATPHDCEISLTRVFDAPRGLVFDALTKCELLGWRGVYREMVRPERFVVSERLDRLSCSGEALITTVLTEQAGKTTLTMTIRCGPGQTRGERARG